MSTKTVAEIAVIADTKQAREEMKKLAEATGKTFDEVEKQVKGLKTLGNKWEELSKSMVGLQVNDTFKRISDSAKEATGGVLDLNAAFAGYQIAGPWGAAVGAVGVAVAKTANLMDGLGVSIDDLEKKAQKNALETMPGWAKEIYATRDAIAAMNQRLIDTPYYLAKVLEGFSTLYPALKKAREEMQQYDSAPAQVNRGLRQGAAGLQNFIGDAVTRYLGVSGWNPLKYKTGGAAQSDDAATDAGIEAMSRLFGSGQVGNFDVLQMLSDRADARQADKTSAMIRGSSDFNAYRGFQTQLDVFNAGEGARRNAEAYNDFNNAKKSSFLESAFGPIEEFNAYKTAFDTLSGAVGASLTAWIDGSMSAGEAFKKFIGEALKGLAVQLAMESLKHGAYALGSLAFGDARGAALHGKAALAFGVGAAAAAVAAREMHSSAPQTRTPGAPNVAGGAGGDQRGSSTVYVYGDSFAEDNPRDRQLKAERMISRARGNSAVEHR